MKKDMITLGLLTLVSIVNCQLNVTATWNGTKITGPVLIYHDEIAVDPGPTYSFGDIAAPGALVCTSETRPRAGWRRADHEFFRDVTDAVISMINLNQIRTGPLAVPSHTRLSRANEFVDPSAANQNGLWCCRVNSLGDDDNDNVVANFVFVGVYRRGMGSIMTNDVTLMNSGSRFTGNNPTFTLEARTSGGPPTTFTWTRDGVEITSDISLEVDTDPQNQRTDDNIDAYLNSRYVSTLVVTGVFPGVYQYSASNRAMASPRTDSFTIEGGTVTGLTATQTFSSTMGESEIEITWTPPSLSPQSEYQTTIGSEPFVSISAPPHIRTVSEVGVLTVALRTLSRHYPVGTVRTTVTVLGALPPTTTASVQSATSATISWALQMFSLPVNRYMYSLSRTSCQALCDNIHVPDERSSVTTTYPSVAFTDLLEFSNYRLTLTAVFDSFGTEVTAVATEDFMTLTAAPTGFPSTVVDTTTLSTAVVTWNAIECIDQNGIISIYVVEFQEQESGVRVTGGEVNGRTYTVSGLTPATRYTFRVTGVTSGGTGPFSPARVVTTLDGSPGAVLNLTVGPKFTAVQISWDAPQMPNGVITQYEVTYRVNGGSLMTNSTELATTFIIIPSLNPGTMVSDISVTAFTSGGRGIVSTAPDFTTQENLELPVVTNVRVEQLTETSVRVSWDAISLPEVTSYRVFYSQVESRKRQVMGELMVEVQGRDQTSVMIEDLVSSVQYQFQVVAIAVLGGMEFVGERSMLALTTTTAPTPRVSTTSKEERETTVIAVTVTFLLTIVLYTTVLMVGCAVWRQSQRDKTRSARDLSTEERSNRSCIDDTYEIPITNSKKSAGGMEMEGNVAYGHVSTGQVGESGSEPVYVNL